MIWTPRKNIVTSRNRQFGNIGLRMGFIAAAGGPVVTVTADTNQAFNFGSDAIARHIWNSDGTLDERDNNNTAVQINADTDWVIPNAAAPGLYRIRHTSATGDTAEFTAAGAINTYIALTSSRTYQVIDTTPTNDGTRSVDYNIQIDDGAGNLLDSALMTLQANREDF